MEKIFCLKSIPSGARANQQIFIDEVLKPIVKKIHKLKESPIEDYHVHFDNAPRHRGSLTTAYLSRVKLNLAENPPYSPDISPCDFWFFGYCKQNLKEEEIEDEDELIFKVRKIVKQVPKNVLQSVFTNWMDRLRTVIKSGGELIK